jgi:cytochrome oxidase Cu insertion factor (SCO1/SenC/PrrC family)
MLRLVAAVLGVSLLLAGSSAGGGVSAVAAAPPVEPLLGPLNIAPLIGREPPPLVLARLADGKKVTLSALRGRPVLVYFWATW